MKNLILLASFILSVHLHGMELQKQPKRGFLIAVEGIDGSGKSTLAQHLYDALKEKYTNVRLTKEPGDTEIGKKLRECLQTQTEPLNPKAEFLMFAADRAEHFSKVIEPLLKQNYIIISDRLADSSLAYQGYGRDLDKDKIQSTNAWAMNDIKPDLTLFVKVSVQIALERIQKRNENATAFEKEELLTKVAQGFDAIYRNYCTCERFKKFSRFNQDYYISQLEKKEYFIGHPATPFNLTIVDPTQFKRMPAKHVKIITIDGTESEEDVAHKTITIVEQWINNQ